MNPSPNNDLGPEVTYLRALAARLSQCIGNPLEWSFIDKGLLFLALYFVANLLLAAVLELTLLYGGEASSLLHPGHLRHALQLQWLFVLALPVFAALLATVRRGRPDDRMIVYLIAVPLMLHDAVLSYAVGWASFPGIWGLLALSVVSLVLFFDWIASLIALSIWATVHIALRTGESLGTLSYAPLFARLPFSKDGVEPAWSLFSNLYLGFVLLVFLALLISTATCA